MYTSNAIVIHTHDSMIHTFIIMLSISVLWIMETKYSITNTIAKHALHLDLSKTAKYVFIFKLSWIHHTGIQKNKNGNDTNLVSKCFDIK